MLVGLQLHAMLTAHFCCRYAGSSYSQAAVRALEGGARRAAHCLRINTIEELMRAGRIITEGLARRF